MMTTLLAIFCTIALGETLMMAKVAGLLPIRPRPRVPALVPVTLRKERDLIPPPLSQD